MMKLHNTLTKQLDEITPLQEDALRIYSCGPTVYDHIHIGNLSSFIFADTLRRVASAEIQDVKHVMNFTDVDDKTIRRSQEKFADLEPMAALEKLTKEYSDIFLTDMEAVGNDVGALQLVKATESVETMQNLIRELYEQKFAYVTDDGVYFSIKAYRDSGKTYGQLTEITDSNTSEARINNDEYDKEAVHDFALWKKQKPDEPAWDFELDGHDLKGRPGWHIECSVMSSSALGQPFDIHTGGVDLIFPHHENEIAQSTAGKSNPIYAKTFVHNEHLLVDGQKMSKSLQNFYTLEDIHQQGFDPLAFRLLVLQSHYRNQAHFSWENLEAAQNRLQRLRTFAVRRFQGQLSDTGDGDWSTSTSAAYGMKILPALENDLDTPGALVIVEQLLDELENNPQASSSEIASFVQLLDQLFGLQLSKLPDISDAQKQLITDREAARQSQDWTQSDSLRDQLAEQGIGLNDTPSGAIWFRL